jgi:hypothetical protein
MGWYTDWFVADIADADAIASIVTDERDFDDWPHLGLKNIGELELSLLWGAIRGDLDVPPDPAGTLLHQREDEDGGGHPGVHCRAGVRHRARTAASRSAAATRGHVALYSRSLL